VNTELEQLHRRYRARLPSKLAELEAALSEARGAPLDGAPLARLRDRAHRLRGSAGSYGLAAVSEAAARIDDLAADDIAWERLEAAMQSLRAAVECARAGQPCENHCAR
jgi:HPt (histidine-containing phosphotransfer) domain-containing protein